MNTRKYPRTMNEAFPKTVEYACSIDRPGRYALRTWPRIVAAAIVCLGITMLVGMAFPAR
jgi:hypothetical protein